MPGSPRPGLGLCPPRAGSSATRYFARALPATQPAGHSLICWWYSDLRVTAQVRQRNASCSRGLGNPSSASSEGEGRSSSAWRGQEDPRQAPGEAGTNNLKSHPGDAAREPPRSPQPALPAGACRTDAGEAPGCTWQPGRCGPFLSRPRRSFPSASFLLALLGSGAAQKGLPGG